MRARRRTWALITGIALTVLAAWYARGVRRDASVWSFLPGGVPEVAAWRDSLVRFDALDAWLVGLDEPTGSLTVEGLSRVDAVTRKLEGLKAGGVLAVRSLTNVLTLREGEGGEVESGLLVPTLPTDAAGLGALKQRVAGSDEVRGALVGRDLGGYAILVRADPRKDAADVARLVRASVEAERGPLQAHYFGAPFFAAVPVAHVMARVSWLVPSCLVLLFAVLFAMGRRWGKALLVVGTASVSLVFWVALTRALGRVLTPTSGNEALVWFGAVGAMAASLLEPPGAVEGGGTEKGKTHEKSGPSRLSIGARIGACAVVLLVGGLVAWDTPFLCTPRAMFSREDEVGRTLAFFDTRFGGSDFVQVDVHGDLTDPSVAARLLRLSDLLEGARGISDVRSVAQVLAFVNHGFGDLHRIPSSRAALANLWFFLEGNGDVRSLVSDRRDEAMVQVRVAPHAEVGAVVDTMGDLIVASKAQTGLSTFQRLDAIFRAAGLLLPAAEATTVVDAAPRQSDAREEANITTQVVARLRVGLASPDSPYSPSEDEWPRFGAALEQGPWGLRERLAPVAAALKGLAPDMQAELVDTLVQREADTRIAVRSERLAQRLEVAYGTPIPEKLAVRAQGAIADLLDPQRDDGHATMTVSGLSVVAGAISAHMRAALGRELALLLGLGLFALPVLGARNGARRILVAWTATALTCLVCRAVRVEPDTGSASLYVMPALLGLVTPASGPGTRAFLCALAAAMLPLLFTGAAPVTRVATIAAVSLVSVAGVAWLLRAGGADRRAAGLVGLVRSAIGGEAHGSSRAT